MKQLIISCLTLIPLATSVCGQGDSKATPSKVDPAASRELIRQWVKTERILSQEKATWQIEKQQMQDLLDLYQKELKLLNEEISKAGASAQLVDKNKERYEADLKQYREAQRVLADTLARLLPRMKSLIEILPTPLLDELSLDSDFLNSAEALAKPRDVMKSMIAVLTAASRFNRSITLAEETREVSVGSKMTVDVLYLGLCRAYYTTASGETAGVGVPQKGGWKWTSSPDLADDVRRTIAVYRKEKQPQLIKLPVKLSSSAQK